MTKNLVLFYFRLVRSQIDFYFLLDFVVVFCNSLFAFKAVVMDLIIWQVTKDDAVDFVVILFS